MTDLTPRCPKCQEATRVSSVEYGQGHKTVFYQCDRCGHAWKTQETAAPSTQTASHDR